MMMRAVYRSTIFIAVILLMACSVFAGTATLGVARSSDGVPISYSVQGEGAVTLVFVHGWSCDSRYWRMQVPFFEEKCRVVTLDLAGHGHSGFQREIYTLEAFARDVKAVVEDINAERVILIGHSMGGSVIAEAARMMPERVRGLIGVDTLQSVEYKMSQQEFEDQMNAFKDDFMKAADAFVRGMFTGDADGGLVSWVAADVSAAPKQVAMSTYAEAMGPYVAGKAAEVFEGLEMPVRCINSDLWPTDVEGNRRHMRSFEVAIMKGAGHFLMIEKPDEFNKLLDGAIASILNWVPEEKKAEESPEEKNKSKDAGPKTED
jgi:pimeloyl-ACP methyl ester carboxylesterase